MLSRDERHEIEDKIAELKAKLDDNYYEEFFSDAKKAEEKYLGKCYKKGDKFYRIISVYTPECPHQLWAVMFDIKSDIEPEHIRRLMMRKEDMYRYGNFKCGGIRVVKVGNNLIESPDSKMDEISQDDFIEAYRVMCKGMEENILKTFSFS